MITKEEKVQIALGTYLNSVWAKRKVFIARGTALRLESMKYILADKKQYEYLMNKGFQTRDAGDELFLRAVKKVYGKDIEIIKWFSHGCTLSNEIVLIYGN